MKNGEAFALVYSIISRGTFDELPDIREQILRVKDRDYVPMVLVANKSDLAEQRQVPEDAAQRMASRFGCALMNTSAKTREGVQFVFEELIRLVLQSREGNANGNEKPKKKKKNSSKEKGGHKTKCVIC